MSRLRVAHLHPQLCRVRTSNGVVVAPCSNSARWGHRRPSVVIVALDTRCWSADLLVAVFNTISLALTCHRNEPIAVSVVVVRAWISLTKLVRNNVCYVADLFADSTPAINRDCRAQPNKGSCAVSWSD